MMNAKLGKMQKVDLRDIFKNEAGDFTPWLAQEDNIALLGEVLGLELEVQKQEANVGPFRADILCKEVQSDKTVLVENQIEPTDHSHLGQILTYAAGVDAAFVIWIAQKFTDEHRAALSWLNEKFEGIEGAPAFFGVEIEVLKIGDSEPAVRFNIVSQPNNWSNRARHAVREAGLTEGQHIYLKYWTALASYLRSSGSILQCGEIKPTFELNMRQPMRGFRSGFFATLRDRYIGTFIGAYNKENVDVLRWLYQNQKDALEREIGSKLEDAEEDGGYWINALREVDPRNMDDWPQQHEWLKNTAEKFARVLPKYVELAPKRK